MENYSFERMILFCFFGLSLIGEPHPIAKFPFKDKRDSEESLLSLSCAYDPLYRFISFAITAKLLFTSFFQICGPSL